MRFLVDVASDAHDSGHSLRAIIPEVRLASKPLPVTECGSHDETARFRYSRMSRYKINAAHM
jgi:hypothetical protein